MSGSIPGDDGGPVGKVSDLVNGTQDRPLSLRDRLSVTRGVWELLDAHPEQATALLTAQPTGTFIVTRNGAGDAKVILIQTREGGADAVGCIPILEDSSAVYLTGSWLRFRDLLELVRFHMVSRDILPDLLRIPDAFQLSSKPELDALATLGANVSFSAAENIFSGEAASAVALTFLAAVHRVAKQPAQSL